MYESITYAELKKLPQIEKPEAWKELKTLYSTQKELADKLGVSPAVVYNMISRYAKDESVGRKKTEKLEIVTKQKKARNRVKKQAEKKEQNVAALETKPVVPEINDVERDSFSIAIKKTISGEDTQFFLNGIGSTLLKNQKYAVEVKITEK